MSVARYLSLRETTRHSQRYRRLTGRIDLRIRHRSDLGHHRFAHKGLPPLQRRPRLHGGHRPDRHHCRRPHRWQAGRHVRPQEGALRHRHPLRHWRARIGPDQRATALHDLPVPRRHRRGRGLGVRPDLHRRDRAPARPAAAWSASCSSTSCSASCSPTCRTSSSPRSAHQRPRLAMDVRRHGHSRRDLPAAARHRAGDAALVAVSRPRPARARPSLRRLATTEKRPRSRSSEIHASLAAARTPTTFRSSPRSTAR